MNQPGRLGLRQPIAEIGPRSQDEPVVRVRRPGHGGITTPSDDSNSTPYSDRRRSGDQGEASSITPGGIDATFTGGIAARRTRGMEDRRTVLRAKTTVPLGRASGFGGPRAVRRRCLRPVTWSHEDRGSSAGACAVPPSTRLGCGRTKTLRASVGSTNGTSFKSQSEHWRIRHRNIEYER